MGAVLLRVVEGDPLLQVGAGCDQLSQPEQGCPQGPMGLQEERRGLEALGYAKELFRQCVRLLQLRPYQIIPPQPMQDREKLRAVADLLAQLARPRIDVFHLGSRIALRGQERHGQGGVQREFVLGAFGGVRQRLEDFEPSGQMPDRFQIGRALDGALARLLPIRDGLRHQACLGIVMRQQLRLGLTALGKLRL